MSSLSDGVLNPPTPEGQRQDRKMALPKPPAQGNKVPSSNPPQPPQPPQAVPAPDMGVPMPQGIPEPQYGMDAQIDPNGTPNEIAPGMLEAPMPGMQEGAARPGDAFSQVPGADQGQGMPQREAIPPPQIDPSQFPPGTFGSPQILNPDVFVRDQGYQATGYDPTIDTQLDIANYNNSLTAGQILQRGGGALFSPEYLGAPSNASWKMDDSTRQSRLNIQNTEQKWYFRERFGWNPNNYSQGTQGEVKPLVPQIEGDVATNGIVSEMADSLYSQFGTYLEKAGYDTSKVKKEKGMLRNISDFLFKDISNIYRGYNAWTENLGDEPRPLASDEQKRYDIIKKNKGAAAADEYKRSTQAFNQKLETGLSFFLNPLGNFNESRDPKGHKAAQDKAVAAFNDTLQRASTGDGDKTRITYGDFGSAGVVSAVMYATNLGMSVATGAVYDIVDNTIQKWRTGEDPHEGSRIAQAILDGRDWSPTQRWTPDRYLSFMEPEGQKPGDLTDPTKLPATALPGTVLWRDAPEMLSVAASRLNKNLQEAKWTLDAEYRELTPSETAHAQKQSQAWHWVTQLLPSLGVEFLSDGVIDNLLSFGAKQAARGVDAGLRKVDDVATELVSARHGLTRDAVDNAMTIRPAPVEAVVKMNPRSSTITIPDANGGMTMTVKLLPEPSGQILDPAKALDPEAVALYVPKANQVNSEKLLSGLENTSRSPIDFARLSNQVADPKGDPLGRIGRALTPNEMAVMRGYDTSLFSEYGKPWNLPNLETATHVLDDSGQAYEITRPFVRETSSEILGVTNANAVAQYKKAESALESVTKEVLTNPTPANIAKHDFTEAQRRMALAKAVDDGAGYDLVRNKLPDEMNVPGARDDGNAYLSARIQLDGEMREVVALETELNQLNREAEQIYKNVEAFPLSRQDLATEIKTKDWSQEGTQLSEFSMAQPSPSLAPPLGEVTNPVLNRKGKPIRDLVENSSGVPLTLDDVTPHSVVARKWGSDRTAKVDVEWFHGTASQAEIRSVNPIQGGTPSEYGLGVYLTKEYDTAVAAGRKGDFANTPFTQVAKNHAEPRIHRVDISRLDGVVLGNDRAGADVRRMWEVSVRETLEQNGLTTQGIKLRDGIKNRDLFNELKVGYFEAHGENLPESVFRQFQQNLTQQMKDVGIKGMYVDRNKIKTMVIYDPALMDVKETIKVARTNKLSETLESARYLEKQAFDQLGDDVSRANYYQAQKDWVDYNIQQTLEARLTKERNLMELAEQVSESQEALQAKARQVAKATNEDLAGNAVKRVNDEYGIPIGKIKENFCG